MVRRTIKERFSRKAGSVGKLEGLQFQGSALQLDHRGSHKGDSEGLEPCHLLTVGDEGAVATNQQVLGPAQRGLHHQKIGGACYQHGPGSIPMLPTVAERTRENTVSPKGTHTQNGIQVVLNSGRQDHGSGHYSGVVAEKRYKAAVWTPLDTLGLKVQNAHACIRLQLLPGNCLQLEGKCAVSREEVVRMPRWRISWKAIGADERFAPSSPQGKPRAQASDSAAYDQTIQHGIRKSHAEIEDVLKSSFPARCCARPGRSSIEDVSERGTAEAQPRQPRRQAGPIFRHLGSVSAQDVRDGGGVPLAAAFGGDALAVEDIGDRLESHTIGAKRLDALDDGQLGLVLLQLALGHSESERRRADVLALGDFVLERGAGALANHLPLPLRDGGHDVEDHAAGGAGGVDLLGDRKQSVFGPEVLLQ